MLIANKGSTDGTQQIIRQYLLDEGLPGEVIEEPWSDFATNRSSALANLRRRTEIDYALIMDADDVLACAPGFDALRFKASLDADVYNLWIRLGAITYHRPQLCSNRKDFRYRGVLHEFLEGPASDRHTSAEAVGLTVVCDRDGSRSQMADKYKRDAEVLEGALKTEQDPLLVSRYTFYLAQSYRDAGELEKALPLYLKRAEQGFWVEERFISLYEAGKIRARLPHHEHQVIGLFLDAFELCPGRAESLHGAMHYCRNHGMHHKGFLIGQYAVTLPRPAEGLFLEHWIYDYGLFDEFSVLAYWSSHYQESFDYAQRLLVEGTIPLNDRERIQKNADFAAAKITFCKGALLH